MSELFVEISKYGLLAIAFAFPVIVYLWTEDKL